MAGEADFPACDNEKLKMFNYFAGFDGDGSSISEPEDFDGWYRDLIQGSGGSGGYKYAMMHKLHII